VIDEFCAHFVYIYSGYIFAEQVFALARGAQRQPWLALGALAVWALVNGGAVHAQVWRIPPIALALGFAGAGAVIAVGALLAKMNWLGFLRLCGEQSLVIYLAFFLPMAATRIILMKTGLIGDIGVMSLIVTAAAVIGPLVLW